MVQSKLKGKLCINRPSYGDGRKLINIKVMDECSRERFLDIEIGYSEFAQVITGMSEVDCSFITRGLDRIGKVKETRNLTFVMPEALNYSNRKDTASKLAIENTPAGWEPSLYFESKGSFVSGEGGVEWANTSMSRWVEDEST